MNRIRRQHKPILQWALGLTLVLVMLLSALPAAATEEAASLGIEMNKHEVDKGDTVRVTVTWAGSDENIKMTLVGNGSEVRQQTIKPDSREGSKKIDLNTGSLETGTYKIEFTRGTHSVHDSFTVKAVTQATITSPTNGAPVVKNPGDKVTVKYNYRVTNDTPVFVRLTDAKGKITDSAKATLKNSESSGSAGLTIPTGTASGKYDLSIVTEEGAKTLSSQQAAVVVEPNVTINITAPKRSDTVARHGGEKVTVDLRYTASAATKVDVKIQRGSSDLLVKSSVSLDKVTSAKSKSVSLTLPKKAAPGRYDLVVEAPLSGKTLDSEREAVLVDAKISAAITAPTKAKPETVKAGKSVAVHFDYTTNIGTDVDVKILGKNNSVLASRTASVDETTRKKSKSVSVSIPSRAKAGAYDVKIYSKYNDKLLSGQDKALTVVDPIELTVESPTKVAPARFNTAGTFDVQFRYTAAVDSSVRLDIRGADGKTRVSETVSLRETDRARSETVSIRLPSDIALGSYDLAVHNRHTDNELALEAKAVRLVSYPLDVQVKLVIGQAGRWVNGDYQSVDLAPRIIENRTLLPIRHVGEPLGWHFTWDNHQKQATVTKDDTIVRVKVNSNTAQVSRDSGRSWQKERIDPGNPSVKPALIAGRVLLPLRFVGETLDTQVDWVAASRAVTVTQ